MLTITIHPVFLHRLEGDLIPVCHSILPIRLAMGLDEAASRAFLKKKGYTDDVIDMLDLSVDSPNPGVISPDKSVCSTCCI